MCMHGCVPCFYVLSRAMIAAMQISVCMCVRACVRGGACMRACLHAYVHVCSSVLTVAGRNTSSSNHK